MKISKSGSQGRIGMVLLAQSILSGGERDDDARDLARDMRESYPEEETLIEQLEEMAGPEIEEIPPEKAQELMASSTPAAEIKEAGTSEEKSKCGNSECSKHGEEVSGGSCPACGQKVETASY